MSKTSNQSLNCTEKGNVCTYFGIPIVAGLYGVAAYFSVAFTADEGRIAAFWLGNALVVGLLLHRSVRCKTAVILACCAANTLANIANLDTLTVAAGLALTNAFETTIALALIERIFRHRELNFEKLEQIGLVAAVGVCVPAFMGISAAGVLHLAGDLAIPEKSDVFTENWGRWFAAHGIAIPIFTSMVLIVRNFLRQKTRPDKTLRMRWLSVWLAFVLTVAVVFSQTTYPFLFLALPVVVFSAFRAGMLGTAVTVAGLAIAASVATSLGYGPITLVVGGLREEIIAMQVFLAACLSVGLPVAVMLKNRAADRVELRESRDFIASIVDGVGDVIFKIDKDWRWTYLNSQWSDMTGEPPERALGRDITVGIHPDDLDDLFNLKSKIEAGHTPKDKISLRLFTVDGNMRHVAVGIEPLFDDGEAFCGAIGSFNDVTESIAREHALAESEARFRRLAEASPVGIFQADANGGITYVNAVWLNRFGLNYDDMLGDGWKEAVGEGEEFESDPAFTGFNKPGDVRRRLVKFIDASGEPFWCETVNTAEFDESGKIVGFVGVLNDVTQERLATERLREREAQLVLLADNATDAVLRLSLEGICTYASPSVKRVFGFENSDLVGQQFLTGFHFHPEDHQTVVENFANLSSGDKNHVRLAFRSKSLTRPGTYNWLEASCGLVRDPESGQPSEIIASLRNINETKKLEAELTDARTAAETAVEAKSAFLANMSHEIRTPMNGVIGFTELALTEDISAGQREQLEMIADSGRAMLRLLNDVLDVAKIEAGKMTVASEPTDLRHKLNACLRLMEPVAKQGNLSLTMQIDDDIPQWVRTDAMRLRQIILNLIGNALKFTDEGSVQVLVSAHCTGGKDLIRINVKDTGIGIPEDRIASVFESFTQADETTARRFGGSGLGLPISAQLAGLLGGELTATSKLGAGSTFTLTIPLAVCDAPQAKGGEEGISQADRHDGSLRVLVAEDNAINQQLTLSMLEKLGIHADLAKDGKEAFAMATQQNRAGTPYGIVLMDIQMPNLDGLEATRRLRSSGFDAQTLPIVALTANAYPEDIAACRAAGMQDHLSKPLRMRDLEAALSAWGNWAGDTDPPEIEVETNPKLVKMFAERKLDAIKAIDEALRDGRFAEETLGALASKLHQIAGIAAFFGEAKLGVASSAIETILPLSEAKDVPAMLEEMKRLLSA